MKIIISVLVVAFAAIYPIQATAQSLPTNSPPIQRTIVEESAETFSQPTDVEEESNSNKSVYGLLASGLALVAIAGIILLFWTNQRVKKE